MIGVLWCYYLEAVDLGRADGREDGMLLAVLAGE